MSIQKLTRIAAATLLIASSAFAQSQDIKIANIVEMSGPGTTSGVMFKQGVEMAIKEINAAGGISGRKISYTSEDTQSNPGVAKGLTQKAIDNDVFAIMGPVFSGSIMVSMTESKRGETPNFTGGEAAAITQQGNPWVFRTAFGQSVSFPKLARYINAKSKKLAVLYVNNDFGKGGQSTIKQLLATGPTQIVVEISTESGQIDFSAAVIQAKQSGADALFAYTNEEESARLLRELRKQGWNKPVIGETVLTSAKVVELAGEAANGAVAHVGLTVEAPQLQAWGKKYQAMYNTVSDHNGVKGYTAMYILKAAIEKSGKVDRKAAATAIRNSCFTAKQYPNVLMDVCFDDKGDIDRESFITEIRNGKTVVAETLPPLNKK
ncbi:MAG: amino acid ABC transporter substrate-binding protein [Betaproteobacteria bacterium]|nr:amino acid ABC transporter substrate-binding protein [Betaproteobacteria bacterium]NBT66919.1 amino acid ABC transporter substrate-binding protein [Betaproteobacteria bacterium]NBY06800.1 amino acid ABC transporter substrate-binding protein [Betaproteobacteria bacterium]